MAIGRRTRISDKIPQLVIESHPIEYTGFPFLTLLQYNKQKLLTIIDNSDDMCIKAYVLDMCGPELINEEIILEVASIWYAENREKYPISIEFSKLGLSGISSKIYRTFNIDYVTRVIGPIATFNMKSTKNVRRRKRKELPSNVTITGKSTCSPTE
jgi:hypothetical protein